MGTFIQINANKNIQTANNSSFSKESVEQKQTPLSKSTLSTARSYHTVISTTWAVFENTINAALKYCM